MRERPILFSGPMVRAILDGRKTQTRRLVKPQPKGLIQHVVGGIGHLPRGLVPEVRCPYGVPGDRLWVRETWKSEDESCDNDRDDHEHGPHCEQTYVYYKATPREGYRPKPDRARIVYLDESTPLTSWYTSGWRPSIHMPRWASRLTLEVTGVRVERLQDISPRDALAEGVTLPKDIAENHDDAERLIKARSPGACVVAAGEFTDLWDSVNAKRAPWDASPWVWVVSFRRVSPLSFLPPEAVRRSGGRWLTRCPFHDDSTPSFAVYRTKGGAWGWACYGCGEHGTVIDMVMRLERLSFPEAVKRLGGGTPERGLTEDQRFDLFGDRPPRGTGWVVCCDTRGCNGSVEVTDERESGTLELVCRLDHLRGLGWLVSHGAERSRCPTCADHLRAVERLKRRAKNLGAPGVPCAATAAKRGPAQMAGDVAVRAARRDTQRVAAIDGNHPSLRPGGRSTPGLG